MQRNTLTKIGAWAATALIVSLMISLPLVAAQGIGDFGSSLQDIKDRLGKDKIEVIDYDKKTDWGNLPQEIITKLQTATAHYNNLDDIAALIPVAALAQRITPQAELMKNVPLLSSAEADAVIAEVEARAYAGENQIHIIVTEVAKVMRNLIAGLAIIWILISGAQMILARGDETKITEQKHSIVYAVIGLVAILLIERMIYILYGTPAEYRNALVINDARFSDEILGAVGFIKAVIGAVAIVMIIVSGVRTLFAQGAEEELTKQRKSILWIGIGLLLILVNEVVVKNIFIIPVAQNNQISSSNVNALISFFGRIMQFFLAFVGVIALGALIYGAASMIINFGNEEMTTRGKKILKSAITGIIVILSAYAIVATLIGFK